MNATAPAASRRGPTALAYGASALVLVLSPLSGAPMIAALPAVIPGLAMVMTMAGRGSVPGPTGPLVPAAAVVIAAAVAVVLGDGGWIGPLAAVVPVSALAAASTGRRAAAVAPVPVLAAAFLAVDGAARFEVVAASVGAIAAAEVVTRAGRWLSDGVQQQRRRLSELGQLLRAADVLAALDDDNRAAATISSLGRELLGADGSALLVRSDGGVLVATRDNDEILPPQGDGSIEGLAARALARSVPAAFEPPELHAAAGVQWLMVVPLQGTAASMGAVVLAFCSPRPVDEVVEELGAMSERFARQAGLTLERIRSLQRVAAAALRDPLTGVGNRRALESVLAQLRPGDAVGLFDLDHFKSVNDRFGHAEGDRALVAFAHHLRRATPHDAVVGRWGGEEFIVILRGVHHRAGIAVEEIRVAWVATEPRTTFSAGVSLWHRGHDVEMLLEEADQALYSAKARGRNQVMSCDGVAIVAESATEDASKTAVEPTSPR